MRNKWIKKGEMPAPSVKTGNAHFRRRTRLKAAVRILHSPAANALLALENGVRCS